MVGRRGFVLLSLDLFSGALAVSFREGIYPILPGRNPKQLPGMYKTIANNGRIYQPVASNWWVNPGLLNHQPAASILPGVSKKEKPALPFRSLSQPLLRLTQWESHRFWWMFGTSFTTKSLPFCERHEWNGITVTHIFLGIEKPAFFHRLNGVHGCVFFHQRWRFNIFWGRSPL